MRPTCSPVGPGRNAAGSCRGSRAARLVVPRRHHVPYADLQRRRGPIDRSRLLPDDGPEPMGAGQPAIAVAGGESWTSSRMGSPECWLPRGDPIALATALNSMMADSAVAVGHGAQGARAGALVHSVRSGGTRREPLRAADRRRIDAPVIDRSALGVASTATQTADLIRMTHRDRVRPGDLGGRPGSPRVARRRPHTRRRRPIRCRGPSCPSRFHPTPLRPLLRTCPPPSSWLHGPDGPALGGSPRSGPL